MNMKQITEIVGLPKSTIYDWSKKEESDWRKKVYIIFKNMPLENGINYLEMGNIEDLSFDEMDDKIHLYMSVKNTISDKDKE